MSLSEIKVIDQITVGEGSMIYVRELTRVMKDGVQIAESFHRWTFGPGDTITVNDPRVSAIAAVLWTQDVIDAHHATLNAGAPPLPNVSQPPMPTDA